MDKVYCPKCMNEVEVVQACGAVNFFCDHCKELVSSKKILKEQDLKSSK